MATTVKEEQQQEEERPPPPPSPSPTAWYKRMVVLQAQQQAFQAVNAHHQHQLAQYQATLVEQTLHAILDPAEAAAGLS